MGNLLDSGSILYYKVLKSNELKNLYQELFDGLFSNTEKDYLKGFSDDSHIYMRKYKDELYKRKPHLIK